MTDDIVTLRNSYVLSLVERITELEAENERLRAHIEHLVSTHPLAAEYEAQTADPSAWMTDREARREQ